MDKKEFKEIKEKRHQEFLEKQKEIKLTKQSTLLIPTTMVDP